MTEEVGPEDQFANSAVIRSIFQGAAVGIAVVATDGRWLNFNQKLCNIVGYPADELAGLTFQDITHPNDLAKDLKLLESST